MVVLRIVSVRTNDEVSRAELADDGTVTYTGGDSAASAVRRWQRTHRDATEADAVRALAREGWSNGYLMVALNQ
jgi:hypothetical protein